MSKINDLIQRFLGEPARNLMHAMYDDYVEANVKFRSRSGMKTFIIRRQLGKCCDWCAGLAGIYESDKAPDGVYQRHDNCKCMVTFRNEEGVYTDAWTKKEYQNQRSARIIRQKELGSERIQIIRKHNGEPVTYKSVTNEYLSKKRRKKGVIQNIPAGVKDKHPEEWEFEKWIHETFGGDIYRLEEIYETNRLNPDYKWNGKLWDLKSPMSENYNTIDKRIKHGLEQIGENYGGLMVDYSNSTLDYETAREYTIKIIANKASKTTDVIIKKGNRFEVIRIIK